MHPCSPGLLLMMQLLSPLNRAAKEQSLTGQHGVHAHACSACELSS